MAGCAVRRSDTLSVAFDEEDIADRANADFPGELPEESLRLMLHMNVHIDLCMRVSMSMCM